MPSPELPTEVVPPASVPILFPSTRQSDAPTSTPIDPFPEMTLAAPEAVPPIVAPVAKTIMPLAAFGTATFPLASVPT